MLSHVRLYLAVLALIVSIAAAGCGGGDQNFSDCGNGRIDDGERCDDGNVDDQDACTSACQPARCGDGVVESGAEDCDGRDLNRGSCASVGLSGALSCDTSCRYDYGVCGPPLPPTATATATFTAAPPTPTATPTPASQCGDGLLSDDETCASCGVDCTPQPCAPDTARADVTVFLDLGSDAPMSPTVMLAYRTNTVDLPAADLLSRFQPDQSGLRVRATDLTYAVQVQTARSGGVMSGAAFTVSFDRCAGAPPPTGSDFVCTITNCGSATDCTCAVAVP